MLQPAFSRIGRTPAIGARVRDLAADFERLGRVTDRAPQIGFLWVRWDDGHEEAVSARAVWTC